jgi:hypothetical protein
MGVYQIEGKLTLNLLTTTIVEPPSNASKWQMGFNSAFKGLKDLMLQGFKVCIVKMLVSGLLHRVGGSFFRNNVTHLLSYIV